MHLLPFASPYRIASLLLAGAAASQAFAAPDPRQQDPKTYQKLEAAGAWTLYLKPNTLDIWKGNPPYEKMKNGHAWFALAWERPVHPTGRDGPAARSALVSYVFSCSEPVSSYFAKVTFFDTAFLPVDDTFLQQWRATQHQVAVIEKDEVPETASWIDAIGTDTRTRWSQAWKSIYTRACRQ